MTVLRLVGRIIAQRFAEEGADVLAVNNEFCYSEGGEPTPGKDYTFRANPKRVEAMKEIGADLLCLANNHVFANDTEGTNNITVAQNCLGVNNGHGMNLI